MSDWEAAGRFADLFRGRDDARGAGTGLVTREGPARSHYAAHLAGEGAGLGIFPLLDDGTCWFAAIDLDEPRFDLAAEMQSYVPGHTWVERSRSGNAHVWAFFCEPLEAWVARGLLREVVTAAGRPKAEVFPKQDRVPAGGVGNFINLPYHGPERPLLRMTDPELARRPIALSEFLRQAPEVRIHAEDWRRRAKLLGVEHPEVRAAGRDRPVGESPYLHRCATYIIANRDENPVRAGHRSVVYFSVAKQLLDWREIDEDEAWAYLTLLEGASPDRVPERELRRIFNNAKRGGYTSTGCDDPLMAPYVDPECPIASA